MKDAVVGADKNLVATNARRGYCRRISGEDRPAGFTKFLVPDYVAALRVDAADVIIPSPDKESLAVAAGFALAHVLAGDLPDDFSIARVKPIDIFVNRSHADDALGNCWPSEYGAPNFFLPIQVAAF